MYILASPKSRLRDCRAAAGGCLRRLAIQQKGATMKNIKLADGYANWLEYAILHFDASWIMAAYMFDDEPVEREEVHALVRAEYEKLRLQASLPPSKLPPLE